MDRGALEHIQQRTREVLENVITSRSSVALLDFPNHANAGDLLIFRGELAYLEQLGCDVKYVATHTTYDKSVLDRQVPNGPILLQGGGSFGDRYRVYQEFREHVIAENHGRTIIQMPQTFEYSDEEFLARTQEIYAAHPDLTILIRHRHDLEHIAALFPRNRVEFCPDTAFGVGDLRPTSEPDHDLVIIKRIDGESRDDADELPAHLVENAFVADWRLDWFSAADLRWWPRAFVIALLSTRARIRPHIANWSHRSFDRQSEMIVHKAVSTLSRGKVVVTDRLHGAIFGLLLGKQVVAVDNANKKISAACRDYFADNDEVHLTEDFETAIELARQLAVNS